MIQSPIMRKRLRPLRITSLLCILSIVSVLTLRADTIYFKDGEIVSGENISEDNQCVTIVEEGYSVKYQRSKIEGMELGVEVTNEAAERKIAEWGKKQDPKDNYSADALGPYHWTAAEEFAKKLAEETVKMYYENGQLSLEESFEGGASKGLVKLYETNGNLIYLK